MNQNMISNALSISSKSIEDSPNYDDSWTMLKMTNAIITKRGTEGGKPTVDIQLFDEDGNKYIMMATGAIMMALSVMIDAEAKRGMT